MIVLQFRVIPYLLPVISKLSDSSLITVMERKTMARMRRMQTRAMLMPFQFLSSGLEETSSCKIFH